MLAASVASVGLRNPWAQHMKPSEFWVSFPEFWECHCLAVKWVLLLWSTRPVVICSEFWVCLLGSAYIQSAFISGMLISFDRFSLAHGFLILAPPIPGCYFLLCKPPPPPCLFMLSIPISDILPLVPSKKSFTHQDISMETKAKGTKRLCVSFSLVWVLCLHASCQLCRVAFSSCPSDKSHWQATPSPWQEAGNTERSLCWLFA